MNEIEMRRRLRELHQAAARGLADQEALRLAGNFPQGSDGVAYVREMTAKLERFVTETHREKGVPPALDAAMLLHAGEAFTERMAEILATAGFPCKPANDPGTVH